MEHETELKEKIITVANPLAIEISTNELVRSVFTNPDQVLTYARIMAEVLRFQESLPNGGGIHELNSWLADDLATVTEAANGELLAVLGRETILGFPEDEPIPHDISLDDLLSRKRVSHRVLEAAEEVLLAEIYDLGRQAQELETGAGITTVNLRQAVIDGRAARDDLVRYNQRLVASIARKSFGEFLTDDDLLQQGNLGLLEAIERYKPELGFKFSTYATWWIWQSVTRGLHDTEDAIRLPEYQHNRLGLIIRTKQQIEATGQRVTLANLAAETGLDSAQIKDLLDYEHIRRLADLDGTVGDDGDTDFIDMIEDGSVDIETQVFQIQQREGIEKMLAGLPPREAMVLRWRFGLEDGEIRTLEETGQELGVTRERVRQIEKKALQRLREPHRKIRLEKLR